MSSLLKCVVYSITVCFLFFVFAFLLAASCSNSGAVLCPYRIQTLQSILLCIPVGKCLTAQPKGQWTPLDATEVSDSPAAISAVEYSSSSYSGQEAERVSQCLQCLLFFLACYCFLQKKESLLKFSLCLHGSCSSGKLTY